MVEAAVVHDPDYVQELEAVLDSAEAAVAALLLSMILSNPAAGLTAAGFHVSDAINIFKTAKGKIKESIDYGIDNALTPAIIAAMELIRKNRFVGSSLYEIAKNSAYGVVQKASEYYDQDAFYSNVDGSNATDVASRSARISARWMVRDSVFDAQSELAHKLGYTRKRWVTRDDDRVRSSHRFLDGVAVPIGGQFVTQTGALRFPGDMTAPLSETINCRCSLEFL